MIKRERTAHNKAFTPVGLYSIPPLLTFLVSILKIAFMLYVVLNTSSCNSDSREELIISSDWEVNSKQLVVPTCGGYIKKNGGLFESNLDNPLGDALGFIDTGLVKTTFKIQRNGEFSINKNDIPKIKGHWVLVNDSLLKVNGHSEPLNVKVKRIARDSLWIVLPEYINLSNISLHLKRNSNP